jgi:GxxExxY protein
MENTKNHKELVTQEYVNSLSYKIIGCAIEVHKHLRPGLLESVYEECFFDELKEAGLFPKRQIAVPIVYKGKTLGTPLKLDLIVNDLIIIENKAVEALHPIHTAILLSYLTLASKPKGLLFNFCSLNIKDTMVSLVTPEFAKLPKK